MPIRALDRLNNCPRKIKILTCAFQRSIPTPIMDMPKHHLRNQTTQNHEKILSFIGILGFTLAVSSCVSKKQFTDLQTNYTQLQTKHSALQEEYNGAKVKLAEYTSDSKSLAARLAEEQQRNKELKEAYAKLQGSYQSNVQQGNVNISKLVDEINASNKFIKQLVDAKTKSDSLNQVLTNKLTRSLSRTEANDVDVQVIKGVVYISLADNMLYKSGSYEIGERAGETLSKSLNHHRL